MSKKKDIIAWNNFESESELLHVVIIKKRGKKYIEDAFFKWNYPETEEK